jgi:hypothetical protein
MTASERTKKWLLAHPGRNLELQRRWRAKQRAKHPCKACGEAIPYPSQGRQYHANCPKPHQTRVYKNRYTIELGIYKTNRGCVRCGYNKCAAALDFHHRDPKTKSSRIWKVTSEEISKCDILCSNCHHEVHADERNII